MKASPEGHVQVWPVHPERSEVLHEVHARPYEPALPPLRVSHLIFIVKKEHRVRTREHLQQLLDAAGSGLVLGNRNHVSVRVHGVQIRWESHTEFVSYTFLASMDEAASNDAPAWQTMDAQWLARIPGVLLSASQIDVVLGDAPAVRQYANAVLANQHLVGSSIGHGQFSLLCDFQPRPDGTVRFIMGAQEPVEPRRLGRYLQRVLEIETYRLMALLGLPHARRAAASLEEAESGLAALSEALSNLHREDESRVLDDITALATRIESIYAASYTRFSASAAYHQLVLSRVTELSEQPLFDYQSVAQFLERRLNPAMQTCVWTNRRLEDLSRRISNVSALLHTRVSLEQAGDQFEILETINSRQGAQLLLQSTVEGLSVAAITYYGSGLVSHLAKAAVSAGWPISVEWAVAISVPTIALSTWLGLRGLHRRVQRLMPR